MSSLALLCLAGKPGWVLDRELRGALPVLCVVVLFYASAFGCARDSVLGSVTPVFVCLLSLPGRVLDLAWGTQVKESLLTLSPGWRLGSGPAQVLAGSQGMQGRDWDLSLLVSKSRGSQGLSMVWVLGQESTAVLPRRRWAVVGGRMRFRFALISLVLVLVTVLMCFLLLPVLYSMQEGASISMMGKLEC